MTKTKKEKIQALTVCIFFSDFLKYCLINRQHFDRWLIVTVKSDLDTIELCEKFSLDYCFTERIFENGAQFAKGKAINDGLLKLDKEGWIVHLDCDIILPRNMREVLDKIPLTEKNKKSLFGLKGRRTLCAPPNHVSTRNFSNFKKFHILFKKELEKISPEDQKIKFNESKMIRLRNMCRVTTKAGPFMTQWKNFTNYNWNKLIYTFEGGEFEHIGYFQMFHSKYFMKYPEISSDTMVDDVTFRESFPKNKRITIDQDCVHIGLARSGKTYAQVMDALLFKVKTYSDFAYLNKLKKNKKTFGSKLSFRKNSHPNISNNRLYLLNEFDDKQNSNSPGFGWKIWNESLSKYRTQFRQLNNTLTLTYEFFPNTKSDWFGFSIEPRNLFFDKSTYDSLYFDLMVDNLACELEIGYGSKYNTEWLRIDAPTLENKQWYQFKLEFSKKNPINELCSLFIVRSVDSVIRGKISISEVFYTKKEADKIE